MRVFFFVFLVFLLASPGTRADAQVPRDLLRVRAMDPWASQSLESALERSPLARDLVRRLEASDLIVHIVTVSDLSLEIGGTTRFVSIRAGHRYVRISLAHHLSPDGRAAILGHELQHARELAESRAADEDGVRRLFEAIGHRIAGTVGQYETAAAIDAGLLVRHHLRGRARDGILLTTR